LSLIHPFQQDLVVRIHNRVIDFEVQTTGAAIDQGAEAEEEIENKELDELERKDLERLLMMDTFPWNLD
jgi:hypothetical protein